MFIITHLLLELIARIQKNYFKKRYFIYVQNKKKKTCLESWNFQLLIYNCIYPSNLIKLNFQRYIQR